jgi:hypothetical protein
LVERISAAAYGTILVLVALTAIDVARVKSGLGWGLVTGVGVATYIAHLYAEVVGAHLRHGRAVRRHEVREAMVDGIPIPLAAFPPAVVLFLGRVDVLDPTVALWGAVAAAFVQLVGLGAYVGATVASRSAGAWLYAAATIIIGTVVVALKVLLAH